MSESRSPGHRQEREQARAHRQRHDHSHGKRLDYDKDNHSDYNSVYFDEMARTYDDLPHTQEVGRKVGVSLLKEYHFDEESTCAMDFACGTGLISRELAPYVKKIIGVDISQGMVDQYNLRVANQGISPEEMHAVCADLKGINDELDGQKFDVVVCSMAYHHFESIDNVTRTLSSFLKPGATLLVVDIWKTEDDIPDAPGSLKCEENHVVAHKGGFTEHAMRSAFESAGLDSFSFRPCVRIASGERKLLLFVAKGQEPA